jgi:hypothetical protein
MDNYWIRFGFDARLKNVEKAVANVAAFLHFIHFLIQYG